VLLNNGGDDLAISASGSFVFATELANGAPYNVTVRTQPTSPNQNCVVSNGSGSVGKRDVSNVSIVCTTLVYTIGGTVSGLKSPGLVLSNNGADSLPVSTDGPFAFATSVPVGGEYVIAVKSQPANGAQNCVVMNGTARGTVTSANVTSARVLCADVGRFAYILNAESSNASGWSIDAAAGILTALPGSPFPFSVSSTHPNGKFAYAAGGHVYAINRDTGALSEVAGSPFASASPSVVTPNGKFGYLPRSGGCTPPPPGVINPCMPLPGSVSASRIDSNTGGLEAVAGSPFAAGISPCSASIDASGRFLYVANCGNTHLGGGGNISAYAIDSTTGALAPVTGSPFAARGFPTSVDVAPNGAFVYVVDSGFLLVYSVDSGTGGLTLLADRTVMDAGVTAIEIDPSGSFANGGCADGICNFALDATSGAVTMLPSIPIGDVARPSMLKFDPSGKFVYGPCGSYACAFAIDATSGALTAVPGSPLPVGLARRFVAFHPSGRFAYVANTDVSNSVSSFRVDSETGGLTEVAGSPYATVRNPVSIAVNRGGRHLYVLSAPGTRQQPWWVTWWGTPGESAAASGSISAFTIDSSSGVLNAVPGGPVATGLDPVSISAEPGDRFVYVVNRMSGSVSGFAIDAVTGGLQGLVGSPYYLGGAIPTAPSAVAIEPTGRFMYVPIPRDTGGSDYTYSLVAALGINAIDGALSAIAGPFAAGSGSRSIAVAPNGRFAYIANYGSEDISAYAIDSATGAFASLPGSPYAVGAYPRAIVIEPSGRFAYVLANDAGEGNIFAYGIDGLTGVLTKRFAMSLTACSSTSMSFDPSGRFAYVPCPAGVWILRFDGNTGALTEVPGNPFAPGMLNPLSVAVTN
jgi:6-phosphogluconolactonase (cycloisomerase 2 family)